MLCLFLLVTYFTVYSFQPLHRPCSECFERSLSLSVIALVLLVSVFCLCQLLLVKVKVKSFPGLMVPYCVGGDVKHCSINQSINQSPIGRCWSLFNVALSWTPAEAARPWIQGYYISWYARLLPSFRWYSLTDPGVTARWFGIGTLVQSTYGRDLNPWPCGCKSSALPHSH